MDLNTNSAIVVATLIGAAIIATATVIAVLIASRIQTKTQAKIAKDQQRNDTYVTLLSVRGLPIKPEAWQAFNRVPAEFKDKRFASVMVAWNACISLSDPSPLWPLLISEMGKALGYSEVNANLWYRPVGDLLVTPPAQTAQLSAQSTATKTPQIGSNGTTVS